MRQPWIGGTGLHDTAAGDYAVAEPHQSALRNQPTYHGGGDAQGIRDASRSLHGQASDALHVRRMPKQRPRLPGLSTAELIFAELRR